MSFKEVTTLRKSGKLKEAYDLAVADLREEKSEWTYSALFWVISDYSKKYLQENQRDSARKCLDKMIDLFENMDDDKGVAERAIDSLRKKLIANYDIIIQTNEESKLGYEEQSYNRLVQLNQTTPIDPALHEYFGWVIFRYLNKKFEEIGSENARRALTIYIRLENERPSLLHSQILNIATKISEKYEDFKFLPFLQMWNVSFFSDEDFRPSYWNNKTINPLVERIIERCFKLGYSFEDIEKAFAGNDIISSKNLVLELYSKLSFFEFARLYKSDQSSLIHNIVSYLDVINKKDVRNEYHSKILSIYLKLLPDNRISEAIPSIEKWGLQNFQDEDWKRKKVENQEFPSLVEKAISLYIKCLKQNQYQNASQVFINLLKDAIECYSDEQMERNYALIIYANGQKDEALSIYRKLILKLNRFYVWKELAEIIEDRDLKVSALCKAILSESDDKFLGEVHLALAKLMIEDNLLDEAKGELMTFKATYQSNGWGLNERYKELAHLIPKSTTGTIDNKKFYSEHLLPAEEFVYSDIEWTVMCVCDVYQVEKEKKVKKYARLVSSEGLEIPLNLKTIKEEKERIIGTCYDVKIIQQNDDKYDIALIRKSEKTVGNIFSSVICYVDYYNKEKRCYHLVSSKNKQLVLKQTVNLQEGQFCSCYEIPQNKKDRPNYAFFERMEDADHAVRMFPVKTAIVDHVNENKQLFHCVFGSGMDIIVRFSETNLRPQIGDYVQIRFITKKIKDDKIVRKMLHIEPTDSSEIKLKQTVTGSISINYNSKGEEFGFVEDFYVPNFLLGGIENDDYVEIDVIFDGEKWRTYKIRKVFND